MSVGLRRVRDTREMGRIDGNRYRWEGREGENEGFRRRM